MTETLRTVYRIAILAFFVGGGVGSFLNGGGSTDTPAVVQASGCVTNAFEFAAVAAAVGLILVAVRALEAKRARPWAAPTPQR